MSDPEEHDLAHPHDLLVRNVLSDADIAADLFRNYLSPEWASALEWDSLKREPGEAVAPHLSKLVGDLRYSARFKGSSEELKVFVFLEHQSRPDRFMSFRMLEYVCAAYREQLPGLKRGRKFPYPLAVVLHHGQTPWKRISPMRELISMTPGVAHDILDLPISLIDLASMPVEGLRGHPMVCALLESLQSASAGILPDRMQGILGRLRGLGGERRVKAWVTALARYYTCIRGEVRNNIDDLVHVFAGLYGRREAETMATTMFEAIQREGRAKGRIEGRTEGRVEGRAEGKVEGKVEGRVESMMTVLESRFGEIPAALQKKLNALRDDGRIEKMLKLAATCRSLAEFQKAL